MVVFDVAYKPIFLFFNNLYFENVRYLRDESDIQHAYNSSPNNPVNKLIQGESRSQCIMQNCHERAVTNQYVQIPVPWIQYFRTLPYVWSAYKFSIRFAHALAFVNSNAQYIVLVLNKSFWLQHI